MAIFLSVHGSIELNDEQLPQLKKIIEANEDKNPYIDSWLVHEKGGWSSFAFFGHTINQTALDAVRSQIRRIATTVKSVDGEFTDFVTGGFRVTHENNEGPHYEWKFSDGRFSEQKLA